MLDDFEKRFERLMETSEYDAVSESLYQVVRAAFLAGYKAAREDNADNKGVA